MRDLLEKLFAAYYQDVYRYLYALSRDADLSEELAAEVFLEVVKSVATFRGESDIRTWLFSIARHRWYAYLRKQGRTPETVELSEFLSDPKKGPEGRLLEKETAQRVRELLAMEPERTRTVVGMRLEGYSFYEIGNKLGISENSARVIDFRAKEKIRKTLSKEGLL